jgi:hypothetical protein
LLAVLSLLHFASSALGGRSCQSNTGTDSVGESLLNSRQENYDRFEEVLVSISQAMISFLSWDHFLYPLCESSYERWQPFRLRNPSWVIALFSSHTRARARAHYLFLSGFISIYLYPFIICCARWRKFWMKECPDQDVALQTVIARYDTSDGPLGPVNPMRIANLNRERVKSPRCLSRRLVEFANQFLPVSKGLSITRWSFRDKK